MSAGPRYRRAFLGAFLLLVAGCTSYVIPDGGALPINPPTPIFTGGGALAIVNSQRPDQERLYIKSGAQTRMANLRDWSDSAIALLTAELERQGVAVRDDAPKVLKVRVTDVDGILGMWVVRCILVLEVESGDGEIEYYSGNIASSIGSQKAANGCVMKAVAAALNSDQFRNYLD